MASYDFVVVGAGVIGASTAYHLKRQRGDARVALLERGKRVAAGNTAKSLALFRNIFTSATSRSLAASSIEYYLSIAEEVKCRTNGYLWLFSQEQWDRLGDAVNATELEQLGVSVLDEREFAGELRIVSDPHPLFPPARHALFGRKCGSLSPVALTRHYASEFESLGGEIIPGADVRLVELTGRETCFAPWNPEQGISVLTDAGGNTYSGGCYVFALGAWMQELLGPIGISTGILPKKRQLFVLDVERSIPEPVVVLPAGGVHFKPVPERNLLTVGMAGDLGVPFGFAGDEADEDCFEKAVRPVLQHYLPHLGQAPIRAKWAGYYAYHWPDKNPVVESVANMVWVGGTSGSGIMKADALGRIAAARALRQETARLYDETEFRTADLSLRHRQVDTEQFIL